MDRILKEERNYILQVGGGGVGGVGKVERVERVDQLVGGWGDGGRVGWVRYGKTHLCISRTSGFVACIVMFW